MGGNSLRPERIENSMSDSPRLETATFAAGCFWGVEESFRNLPGVLRTEVGYAGGTLAKPTYKDVCNGRTGHAEVVQLDFDPTVISYEALLAHFFEMHDPTQVDRQGPDYGDQYRTAVFYHSEEQRQAAAERIAMLNASGRFPRPIATKLESAEQYWSAEEYHQKYLLKRGLGSCHI
jgi:peptide-methionine (S)-S-oxide reductase